MGKGYSERASAGEGTSEFAHRSGGAAPSGRGSLCHRPVIPRRIGESAERQETGLLKRYRIFAVPNISDPVERLYTLGSRIRPLYEPMRRIVGIALTAKLPPGDNWAIHGALSRVQHDDVALDTV